MTRRVLKADEVLHDEPFRLNIDPTATLSCTTAKPAPAASGVRIMQTHPEYAVIEVTCSCGKTTYVRCDYPANPSPARPEPSQAQA